MGHLIGQDPFLGSPIPASKPESLRYVLDSPTNLTVPKPIRFKILPRNYEGRNFFQGSELSLLEGLNVSRGPTLIGKPTWPYLQCAKGGIISGLDSWFHMSVFFDLFESLLPISHLHVPEDRVEYLAGAVVSLSPAFARLQILIRV